MTRAKAARWILSGWLLLGCGGAKTTAGDGSTPSGSSDAGNPFEGALALTVGTVTQGNIEPAGNIDHFWFEAAAGTWYLFSTDTREPVEGGVDTVVTLFDEDGNQVAESDDGFPGLWNASYFYWRAPTAGRFYVRVQDFLTWLPSSGPPRTDTAYGLLVRQVGDEFFVESEPNDDVASSDDLGATVYTAVLGATGAPGDVDVFQMTRDASAIALYVQPHDTSGNGSSTLPERIWITDGNGAIVARIPR